MRWQLITISIMLAFLLAITSAFADNCKETLEIESNCTMITPVINCTNYTYIIYNESQGTVMGQGNLSILTNINDSIYYFNFTLGAGGYIVEICDGSTREVLVTTDKDKMIIGVVILMGLVMGLFVFLGYIFYHQDSFVKYLCFVFWYLALLIPLFMIRMIADSSGVTETIASVLNHIYTIYLIFYFFMIAILLIIVIVVYLQYAVRDVVPMWKQKKNQMEGNNQNNEGGKIY